MKTINNHIVFSDEVKDAILNNKPIVALETTIISHGMPYPDNIETALEIEKIVRDNGCIPATIGIIDGVIKVGLTNEEITKFGTKKDIVKVSRRDLAYVVSKKLWGSLTVAATMIVANMVGIKFFVTGGIGGVHYGASNTFDISADLDELSKTNVCVICAGAKAILDLEKTMEYLETKGVSVIGYKSDYLAAFYSSQSNIKLEYRFDSPEEIATYLHLKDNLGINEGTIISNPIPSEFSIKYEIIDDVVKDSLKKMDDLGIKGKEVTPFLLDEIRKATKGSSLEANKKLIYNNALIGSLICKKYYYK